MSHPAHGLMFHHFYDDRHFRAQGAIDQADLAAMIEQLGPERFVPAETWAALARSGKLTDQLCVTFDDSLQCQYDVALPVLRRFALTGFWFVYTAPIVGEMEMLEIHRKFRCTRFDSVDAFYEGFFAEIERSPHAGAVRDALAGFVPGAYLADFPFYSDSDRRFRFVRDRVLGPGGYHDVMDRMLDAAGVDLQAFAADLWLTAEHLRTLAAEGHVIGLHSHSHPTDLAGLDPDAQRRQYRRNLDVLTDVLGDRPDTVSHPCNSYNADTLNILTELGVTLGFRANLALAGKPHGPLEHPREDHANVMAQLRKAKA